MNGRRIVWPAKENVALESYRMEDVKPDEILIEMDYSVLSAGTEKAWLLGLPNASRQYPQYPGYSGSGHVIAVGAEVDGFKTGDRVLADHLGHRSHAAAKAGDVVKIDDARVSSLDAAFVVIGSMGLQGVRKARLELGESVMVMGLGILGIFAVQAAHLSGGMPVIAVDADEKRTTLAKSLGADDALSPVEPEFSEKVKAYTKGRMVNANIEVSGSYKALQQALEVASGQGRIVLTGCTRVSEEPIDFYKWVHKPGVSIIGAHNFVRPQQDSYPGYWTRRDDFHTLLGLIGDGRLKAGPIVSETVSPTDAVWVYERLVREKNPPLGIVFDWSK